MSLTRRPRLRAPGHTSHLSASDWYPMFASSALRSHEGAGARASCPAAALVTSSLSSQTLREWVAIESDSVQPLPHLRRELSRMMTVAADALRGLGASVDLVDAGAQQVPGSLLSGKGRDLRRR